MLLWKGAHFLFKEYSVKKIILSASLLSTVLLSGCSTILTGDTQTVNVVTSNGKEATINIDGQDFTVPGIAIIQKDGAQTKILSSSTEGCVGTTALNRQVEPTFYVNILTGGPFGSSTDYGTDSMWKYQDNIVLNCNI